MTTTAESIDELEQEALDRLQDCDNLKELDDFHVEFLGRNGRVNDIFESMEEFPEDQRAKIGQKTNQLKNKLESKFEEKKDALSSRETPTEVDWLDVTLPGRTSGPGAVHPIHQTINRIVDIFTRMGFRVEKGPEIETDWYNFEALNIPKDHPARDMHDTFYLEDGRLLRTHTSPVQIRTMEEVEPPVRIVVPGRVYRRDADATHSPMFHQVEGLWVDEKTTFDELKGTLELFVHRLLGEETDLRFRPGYFPFTEPSAEIDISFDTGDADEKQWLEILGAGMVDPAVFDAVDYDTDKYQGFAFGMGVERLAMINYGIDNLHPFFENDLRFLEQFTGSEF